MHVQIAPRVITNVPDQNLLSSRFSAFLKLIKSFLVLKFARDYRTANCRQPTESIPQKAKLPHLDLKALLKWHKSMTSRVPVQGSSKYLEDTSNSTVYEKHTFSNTIKSGLYERPTYKCRERLNLHMQKDMNIKVKVFFLFLFFFFFCFFYRFWI